MYKLAVSNTVEFPVKLSVNDAGTRRDFTPRLQGQRLDQDAIAATFRDEPDLSTADFLRRHLTGWADQRIVLNEDGTPADFNADALGVLLGIVGATPLIFTAYMEAIGQAATPAGRAKN